MHDLWIILDIFDFRQAHIVLTLCFEQSLQLAEFRFGDEGVAQRVFFYHVIDVLLVLLVDFVRQR